MNRYENTVISPQAEQQSKVSIATHDVVIIGGGSAGIAIAYGLINRDPALNIGIIEPAETHYYQPGWTMVGGGIFTAQQTARYMADVMPKGVTWYRKYAVSIAPDTHQVVLDDRAVLGYRALVVAPGLELHWEGIEGLTETLGRNGVTSNYSFDMAPYTWELIKSTKQGTALFTQPPMPIKCAGAPQKAMYLACDHWRREGVLTSINVAFHNAGGALFGVDAYVPALMQYINRYGIALNLQQQLVAVDGARSEATFQISNGQEQRAEHVVPFDMLHVVPPQRAPALIRNSLLANNAGWLDLDPKTLQHVRYPDIFGAGDVSGTSNAKTAAAARMQAPIVADNVIAFLAGQGLSKRYHGYGACPLTVEKGRVILAEFGYGGELQPTLPKWLNDSQRATRQAWWLKSQGLPFVYWHFMLKGREWLTR